MEEHGPIDVSTIEDERFGAVFQAVNELPVGTVGQGADGCIRGSNQRLRSWLGYGDANELHGKPVDLIIAAELRDRFREAEKSLVEGRLRAHLTVLQRRDGTTFPVLALPQRFVRRGWEDLVGFHTFVELAAIQTAEHDTADGETPAQTLDRVALELRALSFSLAADRRVRVPLEHPELGELSDREREILVQLADGLRVSTIARRLYLSPHTVRNHLKAVFRKLGVSSQAALLERVGALSAAKR